MTWRVSKTGFSGACIAMVLIFATIWPQASAQAAEATAFDPGNIISDELFYDGSALTATGVQTFLNQRVTRCTLGDPGREIGKVVRWSGQDTPLASKCLRDYSVSTVSRAANAFCSAYSGTANESAASIISKVGRACGISPKVLLVMLEKEQSLVSDSWPNELQYFRAMGYACPDSGPNNSAACDASEGGFMQQVYRAAWQLKVYKAYPTNYNYRPFQVNRIQWHPNAGCGTSNVYIENWATAALYIYTPYRPNQAALDAQWGTGNECSSYGNRNFFMFYSTWFGSASVGRPNDPLIEVQANISGLKQATISGWAFDPNVSTPVSIHAYLDAPYGQSGSRWGGEYVANKPSSFVATHYPSYGSNHGFEIPVAGITQPTQVCLYAINAPGTLGGNTFFGCSTATPNTGTPIGNYEGVSLSGLTAKVQAWTIDPDDEGAVSVHAYLGGPYGVGRWGGQFVADSSRLDIAGAYPGYGAAHGLSAQISVPIGSTPICIYAIDRQIVGASTFLGCKTVSTPAGPPFGSLDSVSVGPSNLILKGWAIDPDTAASLDLHVYIDGIWGGAYKADATRLDVGRAYPGFGDQHGFELDLGGRVAGGASRNVCIYGINVGTGHNSLIACTQVKKAGGDPFGSFDSIVSDGVSANVGGWAIDPDSAEPVAVHAYVNGRWGGAFVANTPRADVGRAYPGYGDNHGYSLSVPLAPGLNQICLYGINVGSGATNPQLGCRTIAR